MNIRSLTSLFFPKEIKRVERKTDSASPDRESQAGAGEGDNQKKRKMTEEEIQAAVETLKQVQGVKDNHLTVRVDRAQDIVVVYVEDNTGKVIRRIPEADLWSLSQEKGKTKGHLFDKAM